LARATRHLLPAPCAFPTRSQTPLACREVSARAVTGFGWQVRFCEMGFDGGCLARVLRDRGGRGQLLLVPTDWRCVPNAMRCARPETGSLARFHLAGTSARCSEPTTRHVTITHVTSTVHPEDTQPSHMRAVAFWQNGLVVFRHPLDRGPRCAHPDRGTRPPPLSSRRSTFLGFRDTSWRRTPSGAHLPATGRGNDRVAYATFPTGAAESRHSTHRRPAA
jgi:hypothetical protein